MLLGVNKAVFIAYARWLSVAALVGLSGCSTGLMKVDSEPTGSPVVSIESLPPEQQLLLSMDQLGPQASVPLSDGREAVVGADYASASGRTCREVEITALASMSDRRLACRDRGGWVWQPHVLP